MPDGATHSTAARRKKRPRITTLEEQDSPLPHREEEPPWTIDDANTLYMIDRWGSGYFDVNASGNLTIAPLKEQGAKIPILDVVNEALEESLQTPLLIRFQDILHHRVRTINEAFLKAIAENRYQGGYRGVYPIKVNQLREVVEEILSAGASVSLRPRGRAPSPSSSPPSPSTRTPRRSSSATATKTTRSFAPRSSAASSTSA